MAYADLYAENMDNGDFSTQIELEDLYNLLTDSSKGYNKAITPVTRGTLTAHYISEYTNIKATQYLLDSSVWNTNYVVSGKADWAIGGPTLELLAKSYDKVNGTNIYDSIEFMNDKGYKKVLGTRGIFQIGTVWRCDTENKYWLACPSGIYDRLRAVLSRYGGLELYAVNELTYSNVCSFRPIVHLTYNINQLTWDSTNNCYNLP